MHTTRRSTGDGTGNTAVALGGAGTRVLGLLAVTVVSGISGACNSVVAQPLAAESFGGSGGGPATLSSPLQPTFGPTVQASKAPPPVSGGTLIVTSDGRAVASDPDRDAIYVVDLGAQSVAHTIALNAGDEPGRLVEDAAGHVHVALRGSGALLTIDPASGSIISRRAACPAPRGVALDASTGLVWVACATGELVALPSAGGGIAQQFVVERDLRDVVVNDGALSVTKFRTAEVLRLASDGTVSRRDQLPSPVSTFSPHVAWRVVGVPSGAVVAVHQAETTLSLSTTTPGGYGGGGGCSPPGLPVPVATTQSLPPIDLAEAGESEGGTEDTGPGTDAGAGTNCFGGDPGLGAAGGGSGGGLSLPVPLPCGPESGAVLSVLTVLTADGTVTVNTSFSGVLPVDVAVSADNSLVAAVSPGNAFTANTANLATVFEFSQCGAPVSLNLPGGTAPPQPIAVAFDSANDLVVQTREPAELTVISTAGTSTTINLSPNTRADTGFDVFHTQAGGMIACASCHPEGGDDGNVWILDGDRRRTPSLRGTIAGTAPYHWPGDEPNLDVLVNDVYTVRMSGAPLQSPQMDALTSWVQSVPAPPAPTWVNAASATRGKALFDRADVGCVTCHSGAKFTNNQTMDVGTGGLFQVPPLVGVGWRTPLLHGGCALTIADRFGVCATPQHGSIGSLSAGDISDLTAYLETL